MLAGLKLFERKKSYCETILELIGFPKKFTKIRENQLHGSLFFDKAARIL